MSGPIDPERAADAAAERLVAELHVLGPHDVPWIRAIILAAFVPECPAPSKRLIIGGVGR